MSDTDAALVAVGTELRAAIDHLLRVEPEAEGLDGALRIAQILTSAIRELPTVVPPADGLHRRGSTTRNPIDGKANPVAPPVALRIALGENGKHAEGEVTFGSAYSGKPGYVHGGWIAAVFDQLMGYGKLVPALTGTLTVKYRTPIPLDTEVRLWAELQKADGRRRHVHGTMHVGDDLAAEAEALFIIPKDSPEHDEYPLSPS